MKMNKLLGLLVCTALCACSNDESGIIPNDTPNVFTGDKAYIKVRLADAGTLTRAQGGDFEYGTNEQSIKNASFYFYDADGVFVTQGDGWQRLDDNPCRKYRICEQQYCCVERVGQEELS